MKAEPLKGKTQSHCHKLDGRDRHDVHDDTDIKSAIEWLKQKEYVLGSGKCTRCGNHHTYREHVEHKDREKDEFICFSCNLNEAFEDVVK